MPEPALLLLAAFLVAAGAGLLFWPGRGAVPRWRQTRGLTRRVQEEDALKHMLDWALQGRRPTTQSVAGALALSLDRAVTLLQGLQESGLIRLTGGEIELTARGREVARHIVRAHRLWEHHLAEETGFTPADWHGQADAQEHLLTPEEVESLAQRLNYPTHDPHGDPIPPQEGEIVAPQGHPLTMLPPETAGRIVHLEDEPALVYAQLVAEGLHPGQEVRVTESGADRVRFWANGDEHVLAPIVAANITVAPAAAPASTPPSPPLTLADLAPGEAGEVVTISRAYRGAARRRLLDLGILPGTRISAELRSPGGDPTAYLIRGALIALRTAQARHIRVRKMEDAVGAQLEESTHA